MEEIKEILGSSYDTYFKMTNGQIFVASSEFRAKSGEIDGFIVYKEEISECDSNGRVSIDRIVDYFIDYYSTRKNAGLLAEKSDSIFAKGAYDRKSVQMLILRYPFKTFEDRHSLIIVRRRQVNEY